MHKNNAVNLKINKIILPQRQICFLVVFLLMFSGKILGQQIVMGLRSPKPSISSLYSQKLPYKEPLGSNYTYKPAMINPVKPIISLKIIAPSYYASHLGFICKKELQLDKVVAIPLRFRLGSLAYVNYLEQKPNAVNPLR